MEQANKNLKLLLEMDENDVFLSKRGELMLQEDFVQVDNNTELEYAIYFTYHQLLSSSEKNNLFFNKDLILKLDQSIDNLFDNKQFNELFINDDHFHMVIDDIDDKIYRLKNDYFYNSPFFNVLRNGYNTYYRMKSFFNESNEYFSKKFYQSNDREITCDDLDFLFDSDSDSESDKDNKENLLEEEKNSETGEVNPNLVYGDDDGDDEKKEN